MLKQNIVTCLIWVAKSKPKMPLFLGHFKQMINELNERGLIVKTTDGFKKFHVQLLYGVFDMVAKAPILNMHQFNGKNGCPCCLHPGVRIGNTQTYPPGRVYDSRSTISMKTAAAKAERDATVVDGIKGASILASMVDLATGTPIDYMHCILEGVVKRLLEKWVTSPYKPYYLSRQKVEEVDKSLIIQCPPHEFSRAPRSILKHRKFWKASEYRAWLLFYSLPLLITFLPPLYIHHFALLVCSLHILLQPELTPTRIQAANKMLKDFAALIPELYNEKECTINTHLLLHLCEHASTWGPLWGFSAFGFEHKNGYLMSHIHSPHKIADQLLFSLHLNETLDSHQNSLLASESDQVLSFLGLSDMPCLQAKNGQELSVGSYAIGSMCTVTIDNEVWEKIRFTLGDCPRNACTFNQVYHRGTIFHSEKYGRLDSKRNSTVCSFVCNGAEQYGTIDSFYLIESVAVAIIKPFTPASSYLQTIGVSGREILHQYVSVDLLGVFIVQVKHDQTLPLICVALDSITCKCIKICPLSSPFSFVVKIPNTYECH